MTSLHGVVAVGLVSTCSRTYTDDDVTRFCALVGRSARPLPEFLPYLMVIAPLVGLSAELNCLPTRMTWSVARPVRRDETLIAEVEVTRVDPAGDRVRIAFDALVRCDTDVVVEGHSTGVLLA
ncbi:hypothetical protein F0L68_17160 [Solihabitans fulvus]|uniref:Acyl dehydratase n=1 Tax=Solihabitans fulvus TaxID=1892852 RepID=A0A5B2XDS8_9PSEU|nr:hypothetical protein F0L68_17160 [Solihabitans fulvus]